MKNIKKFLSSCGTHFQLRDADLFAPDDLFEFANFGKVLLCLSMLSLCPRVAELRHGVKGFRCASPQLSEEEEVYRSLQDLTNHNPGAHHSLGSSNSNGNSSPFATGTRSHSASSGLVGSTVPARSSHCGDGSTLVNGDCSSLTRRQMRDDCGLRALQLSLRESSGSSSRRRDDEVYQSLCYVTFKLQVIDHICCMHFPHSAMPLRL
ncbi:Calponin domain [Trinorchestia longiramus]|nr:Calponin domain [Trinorchestia longiramus]